MGKDISLAGVFDADNDRYDEAVSCVRFMNPIATRSVL